METNTSVKVSDRVTIAGTPKIRQEIINMQVWFAALPEHIRMHPDVSEAINALDRSRQAIEKLLPR